MKTSVCLQISVLESLQMKLSRATSHQQCICWRS